MIRSLCLAVAMSLAAPVLAKDTVPLEKSMSTAQMQAIGRLDIGSTGFCTATLVSSDLVLTAAHCLFDRNTDRRLDVSEFRFNAGLRRGNAISTMRVKRAAIHPNYNRAKKGDLKNMRYDVALLRLSEPVNLFDVSSLGVSTPQLGRNVGVVSYARNRADTALTESACGMSQRPEGVFVTTCQAGFGTSGAPVVQIQQGLPRVVSVVSAMAKANGQPVSLAVGVSNVLHVLTSAIGS
ncbi:serine protease [Cognatishimia sp.]|uniref:trypsin-like serine peptidase n=1 Tax=Cognatishimia sp. TaxID=2211648 RepID=UPI003510DA06